MGKYGKLFESGYSFEGDGYFNALTDEASKTILMISLLFGSKNLVLAKEWEELLYAEKRVYSDDYIKAESRIKFFTKHKPPHINGH